MRITNPTWIMQSYWFSTRKKSQGQMETSAGQVYDVRTQICIVPGAHLIIWPLDTHNTDVTLNQAESVIRLKNVHCTGWKDNEELSDVSSLDVTIHLTTSEGMYHQHLHGSPY
jgi:hypothetical protein